MHFRRHLSVNNKPPKEQGGLEAFFVCKVLLYAWARTSRETNAYFLHNREMIIKRIQLYNYTLVQFDVYSKAIRLIRSIARIESI